MISNKNKIYVYECLPIDVWLGWTVINKSGACQRVLARAQKIAKRDLKIKRQVNRGPVFRLLFRPLRAESF